MATKRIRVQLPSDLLARCIKAGEIIVQDLLNPTTLEDSMSAAISSHGAELDPILQANAKAAECAFCLWAGFDPLYSVRWRHATTIKSIDRELSDCRMIERELIAKAKPPAVIDQNGTAIEMHQPVIQVTAPKLEPGIGLMKLLHCQAYARENHRDVINVAREHCGQWPQIEQALRMAIPRSP